MEGGGLLLTTAETPIKFSQEILRLQSAILLITQVATTHCPGYQKGDDPMEREIGWLTLRPIGLHWSTRNAPTFWMESLLPCERAKKKNVPEKPALAFKIRHH